MQGRKSKTARILGCLLAALLALAAMAPALATAQTGAEDEYELAPNIPNSDDGNQQVDSGGGAPSASSGGGTGTPSTGATVGEPAAGDPSPGAGGGDKSNGSKGDAKGANASQTPASSAPNEVPSIAPAESSDDGGAPILLILLAIVAAICTGVAIWRLRRQPDQAERESAPGAKPTPSAASETHSL